MLTIIMPMAGRGQRFKDAGYSAPKPMIDVCGLPMGERVRANLPPADKFVVVALTEHREFIWPWMKQVDALNVYPMGIHTAYIPEVTAGAACTVYGVIEEVHPESELLVANCDQWLDWSPAHFIDYCRRSQASVVIPSFRAHSPKWSYLMLRDDGTVRQVVEKRVVSETASCGLYWYRQAADCFTAIEEMVKGDERVNSEFYLAPSIDRLIYAGHRVIPYDVPRMVGLGTPEDFKRALASGVFGDGSQAQN